MSIDYNNKTLLYIFRTILDEMPDLGVLVVDKNQNVLLYNEVSSSFDGMTKDEVEGKPIQNIVKGSWDNVLGQVLATGEARLNYMNTYPIEGGKMVSVFGHAVPIKRDGEVIAAYSLMRLQESLGKQIKLYSQIQKQIDEKKNFDENGTKYTLDDIEGNSEEMHKTIAMCKSASRVGSPVFLYGETGTGKELFAQGIHNASNNKHSKFIGVNCAAIPESLLESIMFGTVKGAFTGAENSMGLFEEVQDGTIFLDEINSMSAVLQSKLLRVLQEKSVRRLGGSEDIPVRCRIISACNELPSECIEKGTLRQDLYYRISAFEIDIPPLRNRGDDIILLADYYNKNYSREYGIKYRPFSDAAKEAMLKYAWPGNVRELQHAVENAIICSMDTEVISLDALRKDITSNSQVSIDDYSDDGDSEECVVDLEAHLLEYERKQILIALERNNWNISRTADALGYKRSKLQFRMKKLEII